jgi:hypothetical protein
MADLVRSCLSHQIIRDTALSVLGGVYAISRLDALLSFEHFARTRIIMIGEPDELLIRPETLAYLIQARGFAYADCDDASMIIAALCAAIGVPVRFRAVGIRPDGSYRHVFTEALNGREPKLGPWIKLDSTVAFEPKISESDLIVEI